MFIKAKAIWLKEKQTEMNTNIRLSATLESLKKAKLHIAVNSFYRLFINGNFVCFGPARTARGYARKDIIDIEKYDNNSGENEIRIEAVGYYCMSLTTCKMPSFITAEIEANGEVLAATGDSFEIFTNPQKLRRVERFSKQRHFGEVWDYRLSDKVGAEFEIVESPKLIDRVVPYPQYEDYMMENAVAVGKAEFDPTIDYPDNKYSGNDINDRWGRFLEEEIEYKPFRFLGKQAYTKLSEGNALPITLKAGEYALFDFGIINCGFLKAQLFAKCEADVIFGTTEYPDSEDFFLGFANMQNVHECLLPEGETEHLSFEPYTAKRIIVLVKSGEITLNSIGINSYQYDMSGAKECTVSDPVIKGIYAAALRTFSHNVVDIYMDCPSRERAGWLCDSFFTGRTEHYLFGNSAVEDAFLENYRLFAGDEMLPDGMLPMCYPSDMISEKDYIPQWCMWYILEVEEYLNYRNTAVDKNLFKPSVEKILAHLEKYENSDGLLQDVPGWNFVDWSKANSWVNNVNYPTNFLYSATLKSAYKLFGNVQWLEKSQKISKKTEELSFNGELFVDNAEKLENGELKNTENTSETAQYYAFAFGNVDYFDPKYETLRGYIENGFPEHIEPKNAFIGLYVRLLALLKHGRRDTLERDVIGFFGKMNEKTGTLWEALRTNASLDHGFASFVVLVIDEIYNKK